MVSNQKEGLARLVIGLETEGPNIRRIAQLIGRDEATVRYWLREKIVKRGFVIQAVPGHEAMGLRRVAAVVRVANPYLPVAREVFVEMSESAYLIGYSGNVLDDSYLLVASVPAELVDDFSRFLTQLKELGFLSQVVEILDFEWSRVLPMKVEAFDFRKMTWDLDLSRQTKAADVKIKPTMRQKMDLTDLLIVRRLQVDARVSAKEMAKSLGLNYKKVLRHLAHVRDRKLVAYFRVRWPGTKYEVKIGRVRSVTHKYLPLDLLVKGVSEDETVNLMLETHKLPFVWFEAGGKNYLCEMLVPLDLANEALLHLKHSTVSFEDRKNICIGVLGEALAFSIAPELFDQKSRRWTFDSARLLEKVERILLMVKSPEP